MKIHGNTILITGGTSGIGRALAEAFHASGNQVIITGRRQELLEAIITTHPGMAGFQLNLQDDASLKRLADKVKTFYPQLNVLIANAGISRPEEIKAEHWDESDVRAMVDTNILGVIRSARTFLPLIKSQPDAVLMATSSALAFLPLAKFPTYCASKAFLHSWLISLRHQLRDIPVEVLELLPPYVQTELTGAHQVSDPRAMPLKSYIDEVMNIIKRGDHPRGEILLERDFSRRWAERDGVFDLMFAMINAT